MLPKNLRSLLVDNNPEKVLAKADRLAEKGRLDGAISVLQDALESGGENGHLRTRLAQLQIAGGKAGEAAQGFRAAIKANPEALQQIHEILEWAKAEGLDAQVLHEVLAENAVSRRDFNLAFRSMERMEREALDSFLEARERQLGRFSPGEDGRLPRSALPLLYTKALIQEAIGEDPKAVETYRQILHNAPGELEVIEPRFQGIVARHYRSAPLRGIMAEVFVQTNRHPQAVEQCVQMVEHDPASADRAATLLEQIVSVQEDPAEALWGLVQVRKQEKSKAGVADAASRLLKTGRFSTELLALLETLDTDGDSDPALQILIGEAACRAGRMDRAVSSFGSISRSESPEIREKAREALERLLSENPGEGSIIAALADLAIHEGRHDDAVGHLRQLGSEAKGAGAVAARLRTILTARPGHAGAESLLSSMASHLNQPALASAFLRRRLRKSRAEAGRVLEELAALRSRYPEDPEYRLAAAEARARIGEMRQAWEEMRPLLDSTTGPDPTLLHLMVYIGGSSQELAHEISEVFFQSAPALAGSPEGQFAMGEMLARTGDYAGAAESFKAAAHFSPAAASEAVQALREICVAKDLSGEAVVYLADLLADSGDYTGAAEALTSAPALNAVPAPLLEKLQNAFRADPENTDLRIAVAAAMAAGGNASHARRLIEDGIRRAGSAAPPRLHLAAGDSWLRENNLTEAVRAYSRAMAQDKSLAAETGRRLARVLEIDVGHAGAHLAMGRSSLLDGRSRDGVNALLTAWSIRPALGGAVLKDLNYAAHAFPLEPQVDLARAQILLGQGEVEAASESMGAALRTSPSIASEVLVRLQAILQSHPSCARAHLHAARAWRLQERCAEASRAFLAAAEHSTELAEQAMVGLAELVRAFPQAPDPYVARARLAEAREQEGAAAEALRSALERGASAEEALEPLRRLSMKEGPNRGPILLELGCAAAARGQVEEACKALEQAAILCPDRMEEIRAAADRLSEDHEENPSARMTRARIALAALDSEAALATAEALLTNHPDRWSAIADLAFEIAEGGGDAVRCAWLRARAFFVGCDYNATADLLTDWAGRCDGTMKYRICRLLGRVERRRGESSAAARWMMEASKLAPSEEAFLADMHSETLEAARASVQCRGTNSEKWRALRAALDLGDAFGAEKMAISLGLDAAMEGHGTTEDRHAAREALALIAALRAEYGRAADLLAEAPPSTLKAHVEKHSGRHLEAISTLAGLEPLETDGSRAARSLYQRLAASEFLDEPAGLEAETRVDFSAA